MRFRPLFILVLALMFSALLAGSPLALQSQPPVTLTCLSLPSGLELPVGQGIEIQVLVQGKARAYSQTGLPPSLDLLVNDELLRTETVPPHGVVALTWVPALTGPQTLTITVRIDGRPLTTINREVVVVAQNLPVRVP